MTIKFKSFVQHSSPTRTVSFTDFINDTGVTVAGQTDNQYSAVKGDTGHYANLVNATNGVMRLQASATGSLQAKTGLVQTLSWKPNQGFGAANHVKPHPFRVASRFRYTDTGAKGINIWFGFTDSVAIEHPVIDTGGAIISAASNAVGFGISTKGQSGEGTNWIGYAVNADVNADPVALDSGSTLAPAGGYHVYELEVKHGPGDTGGVANFYIDGKSVGRLESPVVLTTPMTPAIYVWGDTGGKQLLDIDYIEVSAPRDSGQ